MTPEINVSPLPSSSDAYLRHGWHLIPLAPGTKRPMGDGWNKPGAQLPLPPGCGIGLAHAFSGTMALDVDDWALTEAYLAQGGISLTELYNAPDAVVIDSGRPGHGKLLYALTDPLPSKKLTYRTDDNAVRPFLEFRCAVAHGGATVQDVLPPSIHPNTQQPYRWAGSGHWTRLPPIPGALLAVWTALIEQDKTRTIQTGEPLATSWEEVRSALWAISPDVDRETWIACGMALHWAGHQTQQIDAALTLWDEWSASSVSKYPGEREILTQWRSMRADKMTHVTLGTLFHHARAAGWVRAQPDAASLFSAVEHPTAPQVLIDAGMMTAPPDMDLSLWPAPLRAIAEEMQRSINCDPIVPLIAGLGAACACADGRSRLELMPRFKVPPVLWLCTIGKPSAKKTPASEPMMAILSDIESADRERYAAAMLTWKGKEAAYNAAEKHYLEAAASPEALIGAALPPLPTLPAQPVPLRLRVQDITSQKLVRYAADRPAGFLCHLDEMNSWIRKVCDPRSGEDRSAWVRSYEAKEYAMDRVGAGAIYAANFAMSIYGNVQPGVLRDNIHLMVNDGLLQRFICFPLRRSPPVPGTPLPEWMSCMPAWDACLRTIFALGEQHYTLDRDAYDLFREFQHWYERFKADEDLLGGCEQYMQAVGKIEGTAGRLILMFHLIESPFAREVSADTVRRVLDVVRGYVIPSMRYTLNDLGGLSGEALVGWVREHIIQHAGLSETLSLSQIRRSAKRQLSGIPQMHQELRVLDAMAPLEQANWVMRIEDAPNRHHVIWAINPALATLYADYRTERILAKQRLYDESNRFLAAAGHARRKAVVGYDPVTMG